MFSSAGALENAKFITMTWNTDESEKSPRRWCNQCIDPLGGQLDTIYALMRSRNNIYDYYVVPS